MATWVIGDIQGCFSELQALLAACAYDEQHDRLWLVGDLVNRGPQSLEVLRWARDQGERLVSVLGNHDLHLLAVAAGVEPPRRGDTLDAVLAAPDRDELLDWLRSRPLAHHEGSHLLVHAGVLPQWDTPLVRTLAAEVEAILRGPDLNSFLGNMYGNQPDTWQPDLSGIGRWRVIVNALTRLRFCTPEGQMEFAHKGPPEAAPAGHRPWFEHPRRSHDTTIFCGHWSALGLRLLPNLAALDTGCLWGGSMTAMRLEDRTLVSTPSLQPVKSHGPNARD